MKQTLTPKQKEVFNYIINFINEHRYSPTIREIQEHFEFKSCNSAVSYVHALRDKGYITQASSSGVKSRTMMVVDDLIGKYTISNQQLTQAMTKLKERGYNVSLNEAIELLKLLKVSIA